MTVFSLYDIFQPRCHAFQERRDGVTESCLYVNHVTSDSFRRYTIIAENVIAIGRQQAVLAERMFLACLVFIHGTGYKGIQACSYSWETHPRATGRHLPYGITQCYLPPDTSERAPP